MRMIEVNIEIARCKAPDTHKIDIFTLCKYMDSFGKISEVRRRFDTVMPHEKDNIIRQIHNVYGI